MRVARLRAEEVDGQPRSAQKGWARSRVLVRGYAHLFSTAASALALAQQRLPRVALEMHANGSLCLSVSRVLRLNWSTDFRRRFWPESSLQVDELRALRAQRCPELKCYGR